MSDTGPDQDLSPTLAENASEPEALGPTGQRKAYRFSARKQKDYLDLLRDGGRRGKSARAININVRTINAHMRDPGTGQLTEFGRAVLEAESEANEEVETALFDAAVSGNVTAIQTWLYNRCDDKWSPRTGAQAIAMSGSVAASVSVDAETRSAITDLMTTIDQMGTRLKTPTFNPIPATADDTESEESG
jgi:hypothetical protein